MVFKIVLGFGSSLRRYSGNIDDFLHDKTMSKVENGDSKHFSLFFLDYAEKFLSNRGSRLIIEL